jgi:hypothetical protein
MPLVFLGLAYSVFGVAFWSAIACLVTPEELAGVMANDAGVMAAEDSAHAHQIQKDDRLKIEKKISVQPAKEEHSPSVLASSTMPVSPNVNSARLGFYPPICGNGIRDPLRSMAGPQPHLDLSNTTPRSILSHINPDRRLSPHISLLSRRNSFASARSPRLSTTSLPLLAAARVIPPIGPPTMVIHDPERLSAVRGLNIWVDNGDATRIQGTDVDIAGPSLSPQHGVTWPAIYTHHGVTMSAPSIQPTTMISESSLDESDEHKLSESTLAGASVPVDASGYLAIAYGISTSAMNLALTVVPIAAAAIRQHFATDDNPWLEFQAVEFFFVVELVLASIIAMRVWWIDYRDYGGEKLGGSHMVS